MEIKKAASAGTLESSDAQITVEPNEKGINLSIESTVINQYGKLADTALFVSAGELRQNALFCRY